MAQEFKFGDRVRHPEIKTDCVFVGQYYDAETKEKTWAEVFINDEYEDTTRLVTHEHLELIPHPDTVRLNWLQSNLADVCCYPSQNAGEDWVWACIDSGEHSMAASVREAIDHAMQGEWA